MARNALGPGGGLAINGVVVPVLTAAAPVALGAAAVGTSAAAARADHVHPTTGLVLGNTRLTVSATAPANPAVGDLWVQI